jgi:type II secretion system protein C
MVLRFSERHITALNLLLITALAYFLALSVNDVVLGRVTGGASFHLPAIAPDRTPPAAFHPPSYYAAITRRDIFNLEPASEGPAEVATNLHITLLGTSQLTLERPFIIVEDNNTHQQSLYRLDDEIPDAGKLVGVYKDHAIIIHDGRRARLDMPNQSVGSPAEPMPRPFGIPNLPLRRNFIRPPFGRNGVHLLSPGRYVLDRSTVDSNMNNMASLFTQIRAVPNLSENGQSNGFRLSQIQPNSIFQQIGLRDGDVLTSVEGQDVKDPIRAMEMLGNLRTQSVVNLTVLRDGRPMNLQYNIH